MTEFWKAVAAVATAVTAVVGLIKAFDVPSTSSSKAAMATSAATPAEPQTQATKPKAEQVQIPEPNDEYKETRRVWAKILKDYKSNGLTVKNPTDSDSKP